GPTTSSTPSSRSRGSVSTSPSTAGTPRAWSSPEARAGATYPPWVGSPAGDPPYHPGFEHVDTSVSAAIPMYGAYDLAEIFGRFDRGFGRRIAGRMGSIVVSSTPPEQLAVDVGRT